MKECPKCGAIAADDVLYCGSCGTALSAGTAQQQPNQQQYQQPDQQQYQQPDQQQYQYQQQPYSQSIFGQEENEATAPRARTRAEFFQTDGSNYAKSCVGSAVACYICAGVTLIIMLISKNYYSFIEIAILVGLGLGIQLGKNVVCAIILLVYAIINAIVICATMGTFGGQLLLFAGIFGVISTTNAAKAWNDYQAHTKVLDSQQQGAPTASAAYTAPQKNQEPGANEWKCPKCGKINKNYVGSCGCGEEKPR